jgi:hypothetical protein
VPTLTTYCLVVTVASVLEVKLVAAAMSRELAVDANNCCVRNMGAAVASISPRQCGCSRLRSRRYPCHGKAPRGTTTHDLRPASARLTLFGRRLNLSRCATPARKGRAAASSTYVRSCAPNCWIRSAELSPITQADL